MLAILSPVVYNGDEPLVINLLNADTDYGGYSRRVTRIATLDGSSVFNDFGFSYSDRTISLSWLNESTELEKKIEKIVRLNSLLNVSIVDGVFTAVPEKYTSNQTTGVLSLLVKAKISI
jgi:hypothetical protein